MKPYTAILLLLVVGCSGTRNCLIQPNPTPTVELSCPECNCTYPEHVEVDCMEEIAQIKQDNMRLEMMFNE